ncbi:MAG: acyl-CoA reductase [Flavitalea sp.]
MRLQRRVDLLKKLGDFIISDEEKWRRVKEKASFENPWFLPQFIDFQLNHISSEYLAPAKLDQWIAQYAVPETPATQKNVGIVMAGNIPLAGFHDLLSAFLAGHKQMIKPSSKDFVLIDGMIRFLKELDSEVHEYIFIADRLKGCDAYIATGSNNSSRYFDYYFGRYPHIIRKNRTSAAILTDNESVADLAALSDDVYLYFGLGCRNVTKIFVPPSYDFFPLLEAFKKYDKVSDNHKYRNNYDYQLAILMINKIYYMTNNSILLQENKALFSPISQLHYEFYDDVETVKANLLKNNDVQCIVGRGFTSFGQAQHPELNDYADKADTLQFLLDL